MIFEVLAMVLVLAMAFFVFVWWGPQFAVSQWVPLVFLMFPFAMSLRLTPGIPPLTFFLVTILAVVLLGVTLFRPSNSISLLDFVVVAVVLWNALTSTFNSDKKNGVLQLLDGVFNVLLPYLFVRWLVRPEQIPRWLLGFSVVASVLALVSPLEYLFNLRPAQFLQVLWPDYFLWYPFVRGGHYRVYSMFGHPIHAGLIFSVAFLACLFLWKTKAVRQPKLLLGMAAVNLMAIYMTGSRSSFVIVGAALVVHVFALVRRKMVYVVSLVVLAVGGYFVVLPAVNSYVNSSADFDSLDETQTSAMYRAELLSSYTNLISQRPWFGWGQYYPTVNGQDSIDNYYLYLALEHGLGLPALVILALIGSIGLSARSFFRSDSLRGRQLAWFLVGLLVLMGLLCTLVWLTAQARVLLWILVGFAANVSSLRPKISRPFEKLRGI